MSALSKPEGFHISEETKLLALRCLKGEMSFDDAISQIISEYRHDCRVIFPCVDDTFSYPDSNVLRNLLGITDYDALVSAEGRLTVIASSSVQDRSGRDCPDLSKRHCTSGP